jgi:hypothetical protein
MGILMINSGSSTIRKIKEDIAMPAIIEFPTVVKEAMAQFEHLFANEPERIHFAEYLTGLRGTECFHRDGKQHLGMGDCQLRSGQGQTRHMYMVLLAHSVLMRQLWQNRASEWALERLTTIGQSCWAVLRETLSQTISLAIVYKSVDGVVNVLRHNWLYPNFAEAQLLLIYENGDNQCLF